MDCQICKKEFGEWQCQVCKRIVGAKCARPTNEGVFCLEHVPGTHTREHIPAPQTKQTSSGLKSMLISLIILDIGLGLIIITSNYITEEMDVSAGGIQIQSLIGILQQFGQTLMYGMLALTLVLFIMYIIFNKLKAKT